MVWCVRRGATASEIEGSSCLCYNMQKDGYHNDFTIGLYRSFSCEPMLIFRPHLQWADLTHLPPLSLSLERREREILLLVRS
jgi:hypothetical protein